MKSFYNLIGVFLIVITGVYSAVDPLKFKAALPNDGDITTVQPQPDVEADGDKKPTGNETPKTGENGKEDNQTASPVDNGDKLPQEPIDNTTDGNNSSGGGTNKTDIEISTQINDVTTQLPTTGKASVDESTDATTNAAKVTSPSSNKDDSTAVTENATVTTVAPDDGTTQQPETPESQTNTTVPTPAKSEDDTVTTASPPVEDVTTGSTKTVSVTPTHQVNPKTTPTKTTQSTTPVQTTGAPVQENNRKGGSSNSVKWAFGILIPVALIAGAVVGFLLYKRKARKGRGYETLDEFNYGLQNPTYDIDL